MTETLSSELFQGPHNPRNIGRQQSLENGSCCFWKHSPGEDSYRFLGSELGRACLPSSHLTSESFKESQDPPTLGNSNNHTSEFGLRHE